MAASTEADMWQSWGQDPLDGHPTYQKIQDLNRGSFGFVCLCKHRLTNEIVAVKFIERGDKVTAYVEKEVINHWSLRRHPHVVQFKEVFLTHSYLGIAMEYMDGGDMFDFVTQRTTCIPEDEARWLFQQLIVGVDYCHNMGVVSRDIKLENALLSNSRPPILKLCDFGYSKHEQQSKPDTRVGTPAYIAPEVFMILPGQVYDGKASDVWSCGVMLYVMLVRAFPFERPEDMQAPDGKPNMHRQLQLMVQRILREHYEPLPPQLQLSPECADLVDRLLVKDPNKRITVPEIYQHPWFLKNMPPGMTQLSAPPTQAAQEGMQSLEEIKAIIAEARHVNPSDLV